MDPEVYAKVEVAYSEALKILPKYIPLLKWRNTEEETALDIGCGTGNVTWDILRPLLPKGVRLVGSDIDPKMLKFTAKKYPDLKTFELNIGTENLPVHLCESFDHIFSFYALMWVRNIRQAMQNIHDILKPGGQFFAYYIGSQVFYDIFHKLSVTEKWKPYIPDVKKIWNYYEFDEINVEEVQKMVTDAGFETSKCDIDFRNFELSSMEELKIFMACVTPEYSKLPPNLKEEFSNEALEMLFKHKIWMKENQDTSSKVVVPYNLIIIHATK